MSDGNAIVSDDEAVSSDAVAGEVLNSPEWLARRLAVNAIYAEFLRQHVTIGDVLTHARCGVEIEEHRFTGWDGLWLCGRPTADTKRINNPARMHINDISPASVLYVNRIDVHALPCFPAELRDERLTLAKAKAQST